ncbi:PBSX family phage terminase large subunit [Spirosoma sp.]|uniref:PBSX family phage terminase large subunit n=1 Tax=Spirosoma sp. TaxID=1899569 RepID=UPI00260FA905|nr:PBSX family phage terminase large subunit [Spirosoma sp.]MCX6218364.1 PBSX family phage terminase large subunit [Spirosoma sp.]
MESNKRYIVIVGGSNSSKSYSAHQSECLSLLTAKADTLMLRKKSVDLRKSCYKLVRKNFQSWGYIPDRIAMTYSGDNRAARDKKTGREIAFVGAADIASLKSAAEYCRAVMEEADQFEFEDFLELDRRVRHPTAKVQIVLVLNPVSEDHWIKTQLIDNPAYADQVLVVHCTYHDNEYAAPEDIARLEALKDISEYDYEVYVLGKWGQIRTGKEYVHNFSFVKHVKPAPFIPGTPVHLSWDFNVNPYMTMTCYQIAPSGSGGWQVRQFDEICLEHPRNSVEAVCEEYLARYWHSYPMHLRSQGFVYGDAQGNNRIEGKSNERRYDWVKAGLRPILHNNSDRTMKHNPSVIRQRDFFNNILGGKYPIEWIIDPRCKNTIVDNQKLKQGEVGFLVEKAKDAAGTTYEKYGHCYTTESYFAIGAFSNFFEQDMNRR